MSLQDVVIANRPMRLSSHEEYFPPWAVEQSQHMLQRQAAVFPKGDTWVGRKFGVHTLLTRVDCVLRDGKVCFYEGEDRPDGAGTTSVVNSQFAQRFADIRRMWPTFRWVKSIHRTTDDHLWLGEGLSLEEALSCRDLLLVRSRPEEDAFYPLEDRAIAPVRHEGCKYYGVPLGLWSVLMGADAESVVFPEGSFVVKPKQGTRGRAIGLYLTEVDRAKLPGVKRMSRGDVVRRVLREGGVVCQPFIPAMQLSPAPNMHAIYRMYFGFDTEKGVYQPLGGVWMATADPIVHGKEGAITGPLFVR